MNSKISSTAAAVTSNSGVPTLIWGHLNGKSGNVNVAIAINGVIGAIGPTYAEKGAPLSIEDIVPASLWHNGSNSITAYVVTGRGASTQFHLIHKS